MTDTRAPTIEERHEAGTWLQIGGCNSAGYGRGFIEIRKSTGGHGWKWERATPEELKLILDAVNSRARAGAEGVPVDYESEITSEQVARADELVRSEFERGDWVTVEGESDSPALQTGEAVERDGQEDEARKLYNVHSANDPVVHANRFPTWAELGYGDKQRWLREARARTGAEGVDERTKIARRFNEWSPTPPAGETVERVALDDVTWALCPHFKKWTDDEEVHKNAVCKRCPPLVETSQGAGTTLCRLIAEDAARAALAAMSSPDERARAGADVLIAAIRARGPATEKE